MSNSIGNLETELREIYKNINLNIRSMLHSTNKEVNETNLMKGGNYIVLPDAIGRKKMIKLEKREAIDDDMPMEILLQIYLPDFDINNNYGGRVFHLDEILCLIPTGLGKDDYEIWFYDPICDANPAYQTKLKEIQEINKEILQQYFSEDKIKYFPLKFNTDGTIISPPLFNRILLRRNNRFKIIFPEQSAELTLLIECRLEQIKTTFPAIEYDYINTNKLHYLNGNIHCGFKTIPVI
jgi:hypothetical protein